MAGPTPTGWILRPPGTARQVTLTGLGTVDGFVGDGGGHRRRLYQCG